MSKKRYESNKQQLLSLAKYGVPRPKQGYDPDFTKWLKETKPRWFK